MRATKAGLKRQRLYLQSPPNPEVLDTFGQPIISWTTLGVFWGEVQPLIGKEMVAAKQVKAQAQVKITTRYLGQEIVFSPELQWVIGDKFIPQANVTQGLNTFALTAPALIPIGSWVLFPFVALTGIGDSSLTVYQVTAGSGTSYTISPAYGGSTQSGIRVSQARFFGLFDTNNTEERNRQYVAFGYEIQRGGPI